MDFISYLLVVLEPLRCDLWDSIILNWPSGWDTGKLHGLTLSHGAKQILIDLLLESCCLLYNARKSKVRIFDERESLTKVLPSMAPSRTPKS